jgi:hypothetical protein
VPNGFVKPAGHPADNLTGWRVAVQLVARQRTNGDGFSVMSAFGGKADIQTCGRHVC